MKLIIYFTLFFMELCFSSIAMATGLSDMAEAADVSVISQAPPEEPSSHALKKKGSSSAKVPLDSSLNSTESSKIKPHMLWEKPISSTPLVPKQVTPVSAVPNNQPWNSSKKNDAQFQTTTLQEKPIPSTRIFPTETTSKENLQSFPKNTDIPSKSSGLPQLTPLNEQW